MGNSVSEMAKKSLNLANKQAQQALKVAKNLIQVRFKGFQNELNMHIGDLIKIKGKYVVAFSKQIFYTNQSTNKAVTDTINDFVGLFSGGNIGKSIGNLMKTAFNACSNEFTAGYNQKQNYFTMMGDMGDMFRVDYLYISYTFQAENLIKISEKIKGTYLIVSSIDKVQILDDLNTFEILVNKQFPSIPLRTKFALLKLATAQKIQEINIEQLQEIENSLQAIKEIPIADNPNKKKDDPAPVKSVLQDESQSKTARFFTKNSIRPKEMLQKQSTLTGRVSGIIVKILKSLKKYSQVTIIAYTRSVAVIELKKPKINQRKSMLLQINAFKFVSKGLMMGSANLFQIFNNDEDPFLAYIWNHTAQKIYDDLVEEGSIESGIKRKQFKNHFTLKRWILEKQPDVYQQPFVFHIIFQIQDVTTMRLFYQTIQFSVPLVNKTSLFLIEKYPVCKTLINQLAKQLENEGKTKVKLQGIYEDLITFSFTTNQGFDSYANYDVNTSIRRLTKQQVRQVNYIPENIPSSDVYDSDYLLKNSYPLRTEYQLIEEAGEIGMRQEITTSMHINIIKKNPDDSNNLLVYMKFNDNVIQVDINTRKQK